MERKVLEAHATSWQAAAARKPKTRERRIYPTAIHSGSLGKWRWAHHIWDITHLFFALTTKGVGIDIMIVIFDSSVDAPVRTGPTFTMGFFVKCVILVYIDLYLR
jgi:hypothetical protein